MINQNEFQNRLNLPLEAKELMSLQRIREFWYHNDGKIYVAFSGGKDSTVLLHLVRRIFPEVEGVFVDTGLEYPEIREFVKTIENVTTIRPKKSFYQVIKEYGYPVISKNVSRYVRDLQNPSDNNKKTREIRLGLNKKTTNVGILSKKWKFLVDAPFKCSDRCCDVMKKSPMKIYETKSEKHPIIGTMAWESNSRRMAYLKIGCFNKKKNQLTPMSFWTEKDVWDYIKKYDLKYSKIYDMGEKRTGCMFCMFGVHLEKPTNRFQRMKITHPQMYKYCMEQLKLGEVLDFIGVKKELEGEKE